VIRVENSLQFLWYKARANNKSILQIPAQFDAKTIEDKWYAYWMENNYFHSEPDHRTPYTLSYHHQMWSLAWGIC
jgi:hypothetical protein